MVIDYDADDDKGSRGIGCDNHWTITSTQKLKFVSPGAESAGQPLSLITGIEQQQSRYCLKNSIITTEDWVLSMLITCFGAASLYNGVSPVVVISFYHGL